MLIDDCKYAWRGLFRNRMVTGVVILSLVIAIGPNLSLFGFLDQFLLTGGMSRAPSELMELYMNRHGHYRSLSYRDYNAIVRSASGLGAIGATSRIGGMVDFNGRKELIPLETVSSNYFSLFRIDMAAGRTFMAADDHARDSVPVIISHALWQRRFGGAADAVGKALALNGRSLTIVGIAGKGFRGLETFAGTDIWIPLEQWRQDGLSVYALPRPGVTAAQITTELSNVSRELARLYPATNSDSEIYTFFTRTENMRKRYLFTATIMSLSIMMLLVACLNVCTMLLARAADRKKEIAIRMAAGAGRFHLFRLFFVEGLLFSVIAGLLSVLLTTFLLKTMPAFISIPIITIPEMNVDGHILIYTVILIFIITMIFTLIPMRQTRKLDIFATLKTDKMPHHGKYYLSGFAFLVIAQIVITQAVLSGSGILLTNYYHLWQNNPGFDTAKQLTLFEVIPRRNNNGRMAKIDFGELREKLLSFPGVKNVVYTEKLPLSLDGGNQVYHVKFASTDYVGDYRDIGVARVGPQYFNILGIPIIRGQGFGWQERNNYNVAVINQHLARLAWPDISDTGEAIGRFLKTKDHGELRVIGITADGKYNSLTEDIQPYLYVVTPQVADNGYTLVIEGNNGYSDALIGELRQFIKTYEPHLGIWSVKTWQQHIREANFTYEIPLRIMSFLGLGSLFIAAAGLIGISTYWVRKLSREIGIRLALGCTPAGIVRHTETHLLIPVLIGIFLGIIAALGIANVISSLMVVQVSKVAGIVASALLVLGIALAATIIPIIKYSRLNPGVILRQE